MLQQTQVKTVIPYFQRFMESLPDLNSLAEAEEDVVLSLWSGLGYYSRARNLHRTAKIIMQEFQGEFPKSSQQLENLPGIGRSTAAAILSQAFGLPSAILDGNVKRVLTRYFRISGYPERSDVKNQLWDLANQCMSKTNCADYTQAIMDLGANCCKLRQPNCENCPLQSHCQANSKNEQTLYPEKKPKKIIPLQKQYFIVFSNSQGKIYLEKRPPVGLWGGLWCLPVLDIEKCPLEFTTNNYALTVINQSTLCKFIHKFSHFHLDINAIRLNVEHSNSRLFELPGRWYNLNEFHLLGLATPVSKILSLLEFDIGSKS